MWSNTKSETRRYDQGYEDGLEGRKRRMDDYWYLRGFRAGNELRDEVEGELAS